MAYVSDLHSTEPAEVSVGLSLLARLWFGMLGLGCLVAVPGIWLVDTGVHLPELALIKLGLSVFLGAAGLAGLGHARRTR
ncbi:hypothetical protein [Roseivivax sp. CAU 1753]